MTKKSKTAESNPLNFYYEDIETLIPYARNSKQHSDKQIDQIAASIREFGFLSPIVITEDNTVLAGHGRLLGAKKLGLKKVPCVKEDHLTEAQKRAYIIADNKIGENATWDNEMLNVELSDLQEQAFDLSLLGFDEKELAGIFDDGTEGHDDGFDVEAELENPVFSKAGDIWMLGNHRVICGDSTKEEVFNRLMDGKKANMVLTDPPYNVDVEETAGKILNDNMADAEFYQFLLSAFINMHNVMADDASIYCFHADTEGLNFRRAFQDAGFYLSGCCIWKKDSLVLGRSPYQWMHEPCLFGWKQKGRHEWYADRKQTTIWEFDKPRASKDHPTMKPVPLLVYPIKNSSMSNCIVLDPFLGSGSTLIACEQADRICYGIELDEKFVDVIVKRYIEQKGSDSDVFVIRDGSKISYQAAISS